MRPGAAGMVLLLLAGAACEGRATPPPGPAGPIVGTVLTERTLLIDPAHAERIDFTDGDSWVEVLFDSGLVARPTHVTLRSLRLERPFAPASTTQIPAGLVLELRPPELRLERDVRVRVSVTDPARVMGELFFSQQTDAEWKQGGPLAPRPDAYGSVLLEGIINAPGLWTWRIGPRETIPLPPVARDAGD